MAVTPGPVYFRQKALKVPYALFYKEEIQNSDLFSLDCPYLPLKITKSNPKNRIQMVNSTKNISCQRKLSNFTVVFLSF